MNRLIHRQTGALNNQWKDAQTKKTEDKDTQQVVITSAMSPLISIAWELLPPANLYRACRETLTGQFVDSPTLFILTMFRQLDFFLESERQLDTAREKLSLVTRRMSMAPDGYTVETNCMWGSVDIGIQREMERVKMWSQKMTEREIWR